MVEVVMEDKEEEEIMEEIFIKEETKTIIIMIIEDIIQIGDMATILILIDNIIEKIMISKMKKKEKPNWKKKEYYQILRKNMEKLSRHLKIFFSMNLSKKKKLLILLK